VSVEDVVAQVVEVLSRAESLFAAPCDSTMSGATEAMSEAADASHAIATRTDELGGALASAHHDVLTRLVDRLDWAAGTDAELADHIARVVASHADGAAGATDIRVGAQEVPARFGPWADVPASELAGLIALRNRVADMQRLLAHHSSEAAWSAGAIGGLGYQ
jgi:hypothetical protein